MTDEPTTGQSETEVDSSETEFDLELEPYLDRLSENINRVTKLIEFFRALGKRDGRDDILRAAVVLTHAYLEDFLRTIAGVLLPEGDAGCLKDIPLAGSNFSKRDEKFVLGQLVQHRGKTVDELLQQSVSEYLSRSTYNSTDEIALLLKRLDFDVEKHNQQFAAIDQMIRRRHQIVHRADRVKKANPDTYVLQQINTTEVFACLNATFKFTSGLVTPLTTKLVKLKKSRATTPAGS